MNQLSDSSISAPEKLAAVVREVERLSQRCSEKTSQLSSLRDAQALVEYVPYLYTSSLYDGQHVMFWSHLTLCDMFK
jgi:hypothetical protein